MIPPPQWRAAWPEKYEQGYTVDNLPDLKSMERFQVWMRKAGLSQFRKLWGQINEPFVKGIYQVDIKDTWDAARFSGTKSLLFSEMGLLGSRNEKLSVSLISIGAICGIIGISVWVLRLRAAGDSTLFSWNKKVD